MKNTITINIKCKKCETIKKKTAILNGIILKLYSLYDNCEKCKKTLIYETIERKEIIDKAIKIFTETTKLRTRTAINNNIQKIVNQIEYQIETNKKPIAESNIVKIYENHTRYKDSEKIAGLECEKCETINTVEKDEYRYDEYIICTKCGEEIKIEEIKLIKI